MDKNNPNSKTQHNNLSSQTEQNSIAIGTMEDKMIVPKDKNIRVYTVDNKTRVKRKPAKITKGKRIFIDDTKRARELEQIVHQLIIYKKAEEEVSKAQIINDFVIIDDNSRNLLKIALKGIESENQQIVHIQKSDLPNHLERNLDVEAEKLKQYGLISNYRILSGSLRLTLTSFGKSYFALYHRFGNKKGVFISHQEKDVKYAKLIRTFLLECDVPSDRIYCSSLPFKKIEEKISDEVKWHLNNSVVNILILSNNFYNSYYCLNEAGVIWFNDPISAVIPIALPEFKKENMEGFLSEDYPLYDTNSDKFSSIFDTLDERLDIITKSYQAREHALNNLKKGFDELASMQE